MMLSLLIYSYANGLFSSRKIERASHRDVAVRFLTGNTHPDQDTSFKFRSENFVAFENAFVSVLELATELKLGTVAIDGTHIKANASIDQHVTYERATEIREQLIEKTRTASASMTIGPSSKAIDLSKTSKTHDY
jgi:transposase